MLFKDKVLKIIKTRPSDYWSLDKICLALDISTPSERAEVENALNELYCDGTLTSDVKYKYILSEYKGYMRGTLSGNAKGFAFFRPEEEGIPDYFIPNKNLCGGMHGDKVLVSRDYSESSGDVAYVVRILERGVKEVVGTYQAGKFCGFVLPDDKRFFDDVYIPDGRSKNAKNGSKVVAKITKYGKKNPEGEVIEVLGKVGAPGVDVMSIIRAHNIKTEFEQKTLAEASKLPDHVLKSQYASRTDFRDKNIFTIDGDDSKDFDDAVSIERLSNGNYLLGVHIADVTEYVKEGGAIDEDAYLRGTSVYFVDRVIPMLPESLSNGICSLNEGVDRLTVSCLMQIDKNGNVVDSDVVKGVICSRHRMTYNNVSKMIAGDKELNFRYSDIYSDVMLMNELADVLIKKRDKEGSIDFDTQEAKIILDKNGVAVDIKPYERGKSNRMIEEFMILANCTVAERLFYLELPCVYRIHEEPTEDKLETFSAFVNALGVPFRLPQNGIRSKNLADLLTRLDGNVLYSIINRVMLRSMQKAKYSQFCKEHFGLSKTCYCHFTSPIRRYPDLFVHRMLKFMLDDRFDDRLYNKEFVKAEEVATHSTETERKADEAERDVDELKKTEYMHSLLGEEFDGIVSGVTQFGVFVELENTCEGLIRIETLNDPNLVYNEKMYSLSSGDHSFTLGQKVRIKVVGADVASRRVSFVLA